MNKFVVCMTIANSNICFIKNFFDRGGGATLLVWTGIIPPLAALMTLHMG